MIRPDDDAPAYVEHRALLLLLIAVSLALGWILLPFHGTILWACVIALLFAPVNRLLLRLLRGRRTPAALLTLLLALVSVILPVGLVSASLAREAMQVYEHVQSGDWNPTRFLVRLFDAQPDWVRAVLHLFGLDSLDDVQRRLTAAATKGSQLIATRVFTVGQNTFEVAVSLVITAYIAFFLIRDGDTLVRAVQRAIPLSAEHQDELIGKFATVIRATVKGNLVVAAIQGTLGGIAFWALGIGAPLLWALLMTCVSLVPAVGAALVWVPAAIWLFLVGDVWQGIVLLVYGMLVIGLIDNLLRPMLVGKDTLMPDYVVMITTLGGIAAFGIDGFVLGPAIAAMFIAVWHLHAITRSGAQRDPDNRADPAEPGD